MFRTWLHRLFEQSGQILGKILWYLSAGLLLYTAMCVFLCGLSILFILVLTKLSYWQSWFRIALGILFPTYRFGVPMLSFQQFWLAFPAMLLLLICPWFSFSLARNTIDDAIERQKDPESSIENQVELEIAYLTLFLVLARKENKRWYRRKKQKQRGGGETRPIYKYAGIASFLYVNLSNYLLFPTNRWEEKIVEGRVIVQEASEEASFQTNSTSLTIIESPPLTIADRAQGAFFLFGAIRVFLIKGSEKIEVRIRSTRQRELLAYLAMRTKEQKEITWQIIVTEMYERRIPNNLKKQRQALDNDVKQIRNLLELASQGQGLSYVDPIVAEKGENALWQLNPVYEAIDIIKFESTAEKMKKIRQGPFADSQKVRNDYTTALESYEKGFTAQQRQMQDIGKWANRYYGQYLTMYRELILNIASFEYALGETVSGKEQEDCFRRAAQFYQQYAWVTMPNPDDALERAGQTQQRERAIQSCLEIFSRIGDEASADRIYSKYRDVMEQKSPEWTEDPQTKTLWENAASKLREKQLHNLGIQE